jgi:hypothetical protein
VSNRSRWATERRSQVAARQFPQVCREIVPRLFPAEITNAVLEEQNRR